MIKAAYPRTGVLIALFASLCAGCGAADDGSGNAVGENVIRSRRADGWREDEAWRLRKLTEIGAGEAASVRFGRIADLAIDALGRVWVADGMQQQIKVFRPDGTLVRSIGRKGAGPAEFEDISGFAWAPDGSLWVVDGGNGRFAVFDTAGNLLDTHPRASTLSISPWPGAIDGKGRLADVGATRSAQGQRINLVVRMSPDGRPVDTLRLPPGRDEAFGEIASGPPEHRTVKRAPVPFLGKPVWALDSEGYAWVGMTDRYHVERRSFDGRVERVIELQNAPMRVTRADREQILQNYRWFEEEGGKLDASLIPKNHPDLVNLFFDDEDHLWVLPAYRFQQKPAMDIFGRDGRYMGTIQSPVSIGSHPPPAIRNGLVAAVAIDPDGVQSVVLMVIEKPAG